MEEISVGKGRVRFFDIRAAAAARGQNIARLPFSMRLLLENLVRNADSPAVSEAQIEAVLNWNPGAEPSTEIAFHPARVVLQDFTGVPAVVDLSAMRDALAELGGDPRQINPRFPSELVIDHSVQVDHFGHPDSLMRNARMEYERNQERYQLLRWAQGAFENFSVVPPATGIVHQVNLEYLARVVMNHEGVAYPDTLVGTDSHTTMINGVGVLGWGVGGIEAEAAMLGQPINLLLPQVVGVELTGELHPGITATDLVLSLTQVLRSHGVVGKFVEFYGASLSRVSLETRATIANMSPEFGCTCAYFPVDEETLRYLSLTGRSADQVELVEAYYRAQGLFRDAKTKAPSFSQSIQFDLASVEPTISGPSRPQDKTLLRDSKAAWNRTLEGLLSPEQTQALPGPTVRTTVAENTFELLHGSVVIAAITSCTNTSNPQVMVGAGLVARAAARRGLTVPPWVKTSLAPGSKVVTRYLAESGLLKDLEALGFSVVGYGCTTCIGNSGPLPEAVAQSIRAHDLCVASVLSGNRNFEGRINGDVKANYLASPPLVVAYALAGTMDIDLTREPIGRDNQGQDVFLKDLWPQPREIQHIVDQVVTTESFVQEYASVMEGDATWRSLPTPEGERYQWQADSTYIQKPPFFDGMSRTPSPLESVQDARALLVLGDTVTTDHISPAGSIRADSPAGRYLTDQGISVRNFNSYGSRRGNHEVMMRGTFANVRIRNQLVPGTEGGYSKHLPSGEVDSVFDTAMRYQREGTSLVVLAGKDYGSGSSRDWAAKGTLLLGIVAVLAESFERIHRSNLVGMGVLPLQFEQGESKDTLGLTGEETFDLAGIGEVSPGGHLQVTVRTPDRVSRQFSVRVRIDTGVELSYFRHGGILKYVLRQLAESHATAT